MLLSLLVHALLYIMNVFWFEVGDECQFLHLSHENCNVQHGKLLLKKVASTCTKTAILFELLMFVQFHQLFCCFDCSIILLQNKSHQSNPPVPPLLFLGFSNSSFESAKKQCQEHRIRISKLENGKRILRIFGICEKKKKKNKKTLDFISQLYHVSHSSWSRIIS